MNIKRVTYEEYTKRFYALWLHDLLIVEESYEMVKWMTVFAHFLSCTESTLTHFFDCSIKSLDLLFRKYSTKCLVILTHHIVVRSPKFTNFGFSQNKKNAFFKIIFRISVQINSEWQPERVKWWLSIISGTQAKHWFVRRVGSM